MTIKLKYVKSVVKIPVRTGSGIMTAEELDEILGRGKGDPDMHGYPNQKEFENE